MTCRYINPERGVGQSSSVLSMHFFMCSASDALDTSKSPHTGHRAPPQMHGSGAMSAMGLGFNRPHAKFMTGNFSSLEEFEYTVKSTFAHNSSNFSNGSSSAGDQSPTCTHGDLGCVSSSASSPNRSVRLKTGCRVKCLVLGRGKAVHLCSAPFETLLILSNAGEDKY